MFCVQMEKVWHKVVEQHKSAFRSGIHSVELSPVPFKVGCVI